MVILFIEIENGRFRPLYSDCKPPSGGTLSNIDVMYKSQKKYI